MQFFGSHIITLIHGSARTYIHTYAHTHTSAYFCFSCAYQDFSQHSGAVCESPSQQGEGVVAVYDLTIENPDGYWSPYLLHIGSLVTFDLIAFYDLL